ncbi:MAG: hypothetical protein ACTS7E_01160 [Arsenophonus sp. NC-CH8-MAG3]
MMKLHYQANYNTLKKSDVFFRSEEPASALSKGAKADLNLPFLKDQNQNDIFMISYFSKSY